MAKLVLANAAGSEVHSATYADNRSAYIAAHTVRTFIRPGSAKIFIPGDKGTSGYFIAAKGITAAQVIPDTPAEVSHG